MNCQGIRWSSQNIRHCQHDNICFVKAKWHHVQNIFIWGINWLEDSRLNIFTTVSAFSCPPTSLQTINKHTAKAPLQKTCYAVHGMPKIWCDTALCLQYARHTPQNWWWGVGCLDLNKRREVQSEKETFNLCEYKMRNDIKLCILYLLFRAS